MRSRPPRRLSGKLLTYQVRRVTELRNMMDSARMVRAPFEESARTTALRLSSARGAQ